MNRFLNKDLSAKLLHNLKESGFRWIYEGEKHRITVLDAHGNDALHFRLPILFKAPGKDIIMDEGAHYVILLIQSGNCAIGYFENGINLNHKVFRSYMVRKKQGKSQVKYLKTKGKSRAGSRVRLAGTVEFFENINDRLQEYFEEHTIDRIAISCSKILIPYLYNSKIATPFQKGDERLYKIPRHIHTPIYEVMMDTHRFLLKGELIYQEDQHSLVQQLIGSDMHNLEHDETDLFYEEDETLDEPEEDDWY